MMLEPYIGYFVGAGLVWAGMLLGAWIATRAK
jgi:hypothetical protein